MDIAALWSKDALMSYAGAAIGFFGSRALHQFAVTPLVKAIAGEGGTGLKDPANYKEVSDVLTGVIGAFLAKRLEPQLAAAAAAVAHAKAAEIAPFQSGLVASDLLSALPRALGEALDF